MIGVLSKSSEAVSVREFFECFKTPWEFHVRGRSYDVVIATSEEIPGNIDAALLIIYNSNSTPIDGVLGVVARAATQACAGLDWNGTGFPVYGRTAVVQGAGQPLLKCRGTAETLGLEVPGQPRATVRIGFDLFEEVAFLLSQGQSAKNAPIATLELHISLLRSMMVKGGVPFVEIPPIPAGYDFMACLTHDVDFVGIRDHKWDSTLLGFIYRCFVGSLANTIKGRLSLSKCLRNWMAGLSLPLVYLGWRDDFWLEFDRYLEIERDLGSTFFFIPFKNYAGTRDSGPAPKRRAAKYDLEEIKEQVLDLVGNGCEVGLHGVDAWQDSQKAHTELRRIQDLTGQSEVGTRMHWLYWKESSPQALEGGGLTYDSTFGYNDAVGFRAGTTQAFRPQGAESLLELPLNIQDTALFYPDRMDLTEAEALESCKAVIGNFRSFGGALTINWHTRSLSPERLWGDFYIRLLAEIKKYRVWFGTAKDIAAWFRARRALQFDGVEFEENRVKVKLTGISSTGKPSFFLRVHHPRLASRPGALPAGLAHQDTPWNDRVCVGNGDLTIHLQELEFQGAQHV